MTISDSAAPPEMKLRDQPSSFSHVVMVSPTDARAENMKASAKKQIQTITQGETFGAVEVDIVCPCWRRMFRPDTQ